MTSFRKRTIELLILASLLIIVFSACSAQPRQEQTEELFDVGAVADELLFYANQRVIILAVTAAVLLLLLIIVSLLFIRNRRKQETVENQRRIENRDFLLNTANQAAGILLESNGESFDDDLRRCMGMFGKAVESDRVCIWKNREVDGRLYCTQIYEWLGDAESQINKDLTTDVSYDDMIPGWEETLSRGDCVSSLVRDMTPEEQQQLSPQNILSLFVAPVFVQGEFWGYVGYDNCHNERPYSAAEQSILRSGSLMITNAIVRNEMNQNYQETARQLETVINNYPGIIWSVDSDATATLFNGFYVNFLGLQPEHVIGNTLNELARDPLHADSIPFVYKAFSEKRTQEWTTMKNGKVFSVRAIPIFDANGDMLHIVGNMTDITEMVRLQSDLEEAIKTANAANNAKSDFLARMSHEIRTPMNAIIGMTELALRENQLEAAREHLYTVKQAGTNLLSIINDILDFSKIEQGKMNVVEDDYSVSSLLNDVISIIRMRVVDSQIRFAVNIDSNIPNALIGDESRIRQILINLLGNAVKYTDKGFVSLAVYGEKTDETTINLCMEIKDSGRGIKQEDIKDIFGDYIQSDVDKNRGIEGVGLGLTITNSIIKVMNGTISVYSEYGSGSIFTVSIPQKIRVHNRLAVVENPSEKNVLIYERRETYADSIVYTVENLGVPCELVKNDAEFLKKITTGSWEFVFLSYELLKKNMDFILAREVKSKFILLAEFGEPIPDGNWSVVAMPIHAISVANALNGSTDNYSFNTGGEPNVRFTAPDARVLIVDDINTNLKVAEGLLLPYKMQVDLCKSGFEAIEAVKNGHYDIVFMDHRMPEMDGIEATQRIRGLGGYYADIPIIALTANAVSGMKEMFLENGFDDFISKPIDTVKLNAILENYIHRRKNNQYSERDTDNDSIIQDTDRVLQIDEVDSQKGIIRSGGTIKLYTRTLAAFIADGRDRIPAIMQCLDTENTTLYTTHVHALKSAAANIGAEALSETAKALELAGKNDDFDYIRENTEKFLTDLEWLIDKISTALLQQNEQSRDRNTSVNSKMFKSELVILKDAIENLDADTMNESIDKLQELAHADILDKIKEISKYILLAEYDEAAALTDSLIQIEPR